MHDLQIGAGRSRSAFDIFREDITVDPDGQTVVENTFVEVHTMTPYNNYCVYEYHELK